MQKLQHPYTILSVSASCVKESEHGLEQEDRGSWSNEGRCTG